MVLDTNILIGFLNRSFSSEVHSKLISLITTRFVYSVISRIELLSYPGATNHVREVTKEILSNGTEAGLTNLIIESTISIRSSSRLKLPDAIIAATALVVDQPLITADLRGFEAVEGLKVIRPEMLV